MPATRSKRWLPRWTLRLRLTMLYGGLFLLAGAILLGITYGLVAHGIGGVSQDRQLVVSRIGNRTQLPIPPLPAKTGPGAVYFSRTPNGFAVQLRAYAGKLNATFNRVQGRQIQEVATKAKAALNKQRSVELDSLLTKSGIALGIMAVVSVGLGWLMAGRALRPLRTMGARARGISERNLHERLGLEGADDELKELGDTFDSLLARLEKAFDSQRRFVANASHELRTPITVERTLVELALSDPHSSANSLKDTCRRVLSTVEQQERLIEALLTMARGHRGLAARQQVDLRELTTAVVHSVDCDGVRLEPELETAITTGDPRLLERLVANLVENAVKYNDDRGWVRVSTGVREGRPSLEVVNAGPVIAEDLVAELLQPFRRLNGANGDTPERGQHRGLGLGLSIVAAIAEAHGAELSLVAQPEGGLKAEVRFQVSPVPALD